MTFGAWVQSHRRSVLFLLTVLGLAGLASAWRLPVGLFPRLTFPRVAVSLQAGDRPSDRMATEVTRPVEEAVRAVPGVRSVRSTSSRGSADVSIDFGWGEDMVAATLQVEAAINQTRADLPAGTSFLVRRMDPTVFPVLGCSLTSDTRSLASLRDLALYRLRPLLSTVPGVAKIGVLGGDVEELEVEVEPAKLDAYGLTLTDVAQSLSAANVITAVGRLEDRAKLYLLLADTQLHGPEEAARTILRSGANGQVRLGDVGAVRWGTQPRWTRVSADGHDAVLLNVYQQPGGNTVEIQRELTRSFARLRAQLPADVRVATWYDQSELIVAAARSVRDAVLVGVVLAALVVLVFLRSARVTLIAALTVPMVLAITLLLLSALGMSLNIMTLGGMAAAVGLIIDDAIVMVEHVIRRLHDGQGSARERVLAAAAEMTRPLAGSSASTVVIFAPLAFLSGVTGAFFKALSLTMATSLVISFLVAWLAVPLLALHLLRDEAHEAEERRGPVRRAYARLAGRLIDRPALVLLGVLPLLALGWAAFQRTGSGFMPAMDESGFILDYRAAPGTSLAETDRKLRRLEELIRATPEVLTYSRRTGLSLGGHVTEANEGDFFIRLRPRPRRGIRPVMDDLRGRIEGSIAGLEVEMPQLMEDLIGDLTAVPQPIEVQLLSDDEALLAETAPRVAAALAKVPGVVDLNDGLVVAGDALDVRVDRERAALEGVSPESVTAMIQACLSGVVTTQVQRGPKLVGIRVWIPLAARATAHALGALRLRAPDGHLLPLRRVATISAVTGQPQVTRQDLARMVAVTARISGRDLGSTIRDVRATLDRPGLLPPGMPYRLGGLYRQQQLAFAGLIRVFLGAVALVFVLLLFLYESFRIALAVVCTTLLAIAPVFVGLCLTGTELNITAIMGLTMVIGIVTEGSIFYLSEAGQLSRDLPWRARAILAGERRIRPLLMTTFTAGLALLPLALGIGEGAEMQEPLAIAIISGLSLKIPVVLLALPALLSALGCERDEQG
ncbi:MAG: efflux RND transporter permease subunit [Planctomycetota bacterium]